MAQMPPCLAAGLMQIVQRGARQFQLPPRFQRDRTTGAIFQANDLALLHNRRCRRTNFLEQIGKKLANAVGAIIGNRRMVTDKQEFFMLSSDLPLVSGAFTLQPSRSSPACPGAEN